MANYIDTHQHFWKYDPVRDAWISEEMTAIRKDFGPEDLRPLLEKEGFAACISVQADQSEAETAFLLEYASKYDFIKGVVGWVDLRSGALAKRLEYFSQYKLLKGFRHVVQAEPDDQFLLREDFCNGISQLKAYDFTYDILIYPKQLPAAIAFAAKFPDQAFVLDHIAKPLIKEQIQEPWASHIRQLAAHPNVYCKLSGMVTEADWTNWIYKDYIPYLDTILEAFGPDRLMIGSDWPVCLLGGEYSEVMGIVKQYIGKLSDDEQAAILGGNARRFYRIEN